MKYYPEPHLGLEYRDVNAVIEDVFAEHGRGRVRMPPKVYVLLEGGDFRTMPAYVPFLHMAGVKIVNMHPDNRKRGLPTVMAVTVLLDPENGRPQAVLNATSLTDMRTGAAGGIACRHLASGKEISLGVVGSGRQANAQIAAIAEEREIREVRIWSREVANAERLASMWRHLDARSDTLERVCGCDVLVTTTPSTSPIVKNEWIADGTHINAIGADAPGKQELDPAILKRALVFVDDIEQAVHSGEINVPISRGLFRKEEITGTIGQVILGFCGRRSKGEITIFDSTGLAIQDIAIARLAMQKASGIDLPFPF
ncbi:MAG: ornithine cyclodeaminase family protein [Methanomicrobiales archaeon]|nr:ornithine cyclodeaminase family protein [Methanomicrobiales archaeon]